MIARFIEPARTVRIVPVAPTTRPYVTRAVTVLALSWVPMPPPAPPTSPARPRRPEPSDLKALMTRCWPMIVGIARSRRFRLRCIEPEEFAQELALYATERADRYDPARGTPQKWLWCQARAVRKRCLTRERLRSHEIYLRDPYGSKEGARSEDWFDRQPGNEPSAETLVEIRRLVDGEAPEERAWLRARLVGATYREAAAEAGICPRVLARTGHELCALLREEHARA